MMMNFTIGFFWITWQSRAVILTEAIALVSNNVHLLFISIKLTEEKTNSDTKSDI